jgi:propionyl-CoA carboxylase alpha chain
VEVGAEVVQGQPLLVMEAMKMQHTVTAPRTGTVTELAASVGQQVEAGAVLAVVEEQA